MLVQKFDIGDRVTHKKFGKGIVRNVSFGICEVYFDNLLQTKKITIPFLINESKKDKVIEDELKEKIDDVDTKVKVYPTRYKNNQQLNKLEKEIMNFFEDNKLSGELYVNIHPFTNDKEGRYAFYIEPTKGLVIFQIIDIEDEEFVIQKADMYNQMAEEMEKSIADRLMTSAALILKDNDKKILKIPFKFAFVFQNIQDKKVFGKIEADKLKGHIYFKNLYSLESYKQKILNQNDIRVHMDAFFYKCKNMINNFNYISDIERLAIIDRLAPEYSIVISEKIEKYTNVFNITKDDVKNGFEMLIDGNELEYLNFQLDATQINLVNEIYPGHRLILANAGAGKSVIILSKAYKIASEYPNKNILITCYNNNLNQIYNFKAGIAGFNNINKNLFLKTFHTFIRDTLNEVGYYFDLLDEDEFENALDKIEELISNGKIKRRYLAILIDEVQIFEPRWLDICYMLLADPKEESYFILAGDSNQNIKKQGIKGQNVWQKMENITHPKFTGRVSYIRKNYRNTKQISDFLNNMSSQINSNLKQLGMNNETDFETNVLGSNNVEGSKPIIKFVNRIQIKSEVIDAIETIHKNFNIPYNQIAVIFPFSKHVQQKYYISEWVHNGLRDKGIPYVDIFGSGSLNKKGDVARADGVIVTTIDSSLGLDFKAVIVAGLYSFSYKINDNLTLNGLNKEDRGKAELYSEYAKKIYTACSRAREHLYIISDIGSSSIINDLFKQGE